MTKNTLIICITLFSILIGNSQEFNGSIEAKRYFNKQNAKDTTVHFSIKMLSNSTGLPISEFDTTYSNILICGDTLISSGSSLSGHIITGRIQIKNKIYLYSPKKDQYFLPPILNETIFEKLKKNNFKKIKGEEFNYKLITSFNKKLSYKAKVNGDKIFTKQLKNKGQFANYLNPLGLYEKVVESTSGHTLICSYEMHNETCANYIPHEIENLKRENMMEWVDMFGNDIDKTYLDFPLIELVDLEERPSHIFNKLDKITLIDIWASWCGPCLKELPFLKEIYNKYKDDGLSVISISFDEAKDYDKLRDLVNQHDMQWPHLIDRNGFESDLVTTISLNGIPRYLLLDEKGNIIYTHVPRPSNEALNELIEELLY